MSSGLTWVSVLVCWGCSLVLCLFLTVSSCWSCWNLCAFWFTRYTLSPVVWVGTFFGASVYCSVPEVGVGCGSGEVGIGVGVGVGIRTGIGIGLGLGGCVVSGIGEASDSYCRIGSVWLPSTGADFDLCHSSLSTCCMALYTGCFLAGLGTFCRFSKLGVGHRTTNHRAKMGFISLPFWTPVNCSRSA